MRYLIFIITGMIVFNSTSVAQQKIPHQFFKEKNFSKLFPNKNLLPQLQTPLTLVPPDDLESIITNSAEINKIIILPQDNMPCLVGRIKSHMPISTGLALNDYFPVKIPNSIPELNSEFVFPIDLGSEGFYLK